MKLRDIWVAESASQGGIGRIDTLSWLTKTTLDVIGIAGAYANQATAHALMPDVDV
jgi:hypothetical protein